MDSVGKHVFFMLEASLRPVLLTRHGMFEIVEQSEAHCD